MDRGRGRSAHAVAVQTEVQPAPDPDVARMVIDACRTPWGTTAGSAVGRIHIQQVSPSLQTYVVDAFSSC